MSRKSSFESEERVIPLSVVLMTVGLILLLTVACIWLLIPSRMPQPLYDLVGRRLPSAGRDPSRLPAAVPLPTAANVATVPTVAPRPTTAGTTILLPEAPPTAANEAIFRPELTDLTLPGQPTRIVIPKLFTDAPVIEVALEPFISNGQTFFQWQVPGGYAAGWHNNSARLGEGGNVVINGHHNLEGEVFRNLIDLETGDEIIVYDQDVPYYFEVTNEELLPERDEPLAVRLENARWMEPTEDERLTLITCWPYTDNTHRLVIVARPVVKAEESQ